MGKHETTENRIEKEGAGGGKILWWILAAAMAALTLGKLWYYYTLMDAGSALLPAVGITFVILLVMSMIFKRKWIFGILYLLMTMLMVADVNYFGFFNRKLTLSAIASGGGLLTGVVDSVKAAFNLNSLWLFADALLVILLGIIGAKAAKKKGSRGRFSSLKSRLCFLLATVLLLAGSVAFTPESDSLAGSVLNTEYFSYHLRDFTGIHQIEAAGKDYSNIGNYQGDYESEKEGPDFGVAKDMNLIVIQIEAMQNFVVNRTYNGQVITPFINKLIKEDSFYFDSYFQQTGSGNTADAELATNNSLYGTLDYYTYGIYTNNYWRGLPILLKEKGYTTADVYHPYDKTFWSRDRAYPGLGFDRFYSEEDFTFDPKKDVIGLGMSDSLFFKQSLDIMEEKEEPFYSFMITLSSHYPFEIEDSDFKLLKKDVDTHFGNYLKSMHYVDQCLEEFFEELEERGMADNTIVAFYGDHLGMNPKTVDVRERMSEYLGVDEYSYEDAMNIPLVIHIPGLGKRDTVETVGGQADFLPTIAYLMGWESLDTLYFGHNLLTIEDNFVPVRAYVAEGSFLTGDIMFKMSTAGIFSDSEIVDRRTHETYPLDGYEDLYEKALSMMATADFYLEEDVLRQVYEQGRNLEDVIEDAKAHSTGKGPDEFYSEIPRAPVIVSAANSKDPKRDGLYCLENLNELYDDGVRDIFVNLTWTTDGHTVMCEEPEQLSIYLRNTAGIRTFDDLLYAKEKFTRKGLTLMTGEEVLEWMEKHKDVNLYISQNDWTFVKMKTNVSTESILFAKAMMKEHPKLMDRTIFILKDGEKLKSFIDEGLHNIIFYPVDEYTLENILELKEKYNIYGFLRSYGNIDEMMENWDLKNDPCGLYAYVWEKKEQEYYLKKGLAGVVVLP